MPKEDDDAWHISFFPPKPEWARQNPTQEEHYFIQHTDADVCRNWYMKDLQVVCLSPADSRNTQLTIKDDATAADANADANAMAIHAMCHGHGEP